MSEHTDLSEVGRFAEAQETPEWCVLGAVVGVRLGLVERPYAHRVVWLGPIPVLGGERLAADLVGVRSGTPTHRWIEDLEEWTE